MLAAFGDSADNFEWLALAKIKIGRNEFEKNLAEIKTNLEQNFDVSGETYRQIEIWQIKNLTNQSPPIFYSNAKNFFLIGSNQKKIKEAIDRALKIAK